MSFSWAFAVDISLLSLCTFYWLIDILHEWVFDEVTPEYFSELPRTYKYIGQNSLFEKREYEWNYLPMP